jgi:hypothetical protein
MTNANPYLPPRRRGEPAPLTKPIDVPDHGATPGTDAAPVMQTSQPSSAATVAQKRTTGSRKARALRDTLRSRDGFATALQTAELLAPPVGFRQPVR